jgi:hypothetical protein
MITNAFRRALAVMAVAAASAALSAAYADAAPPVKQLLAGRFGRAVDLTQVDAHGGTALEDVCTVASNDECQEGSESAIAGGFADDEGVAGTTSGDVYVLDTGNGRIQELEADGKFVLMFGSDVNKHGGDLCTAAEASECQAGTPGPDAGQFAVPKSVTVDPVSGDVYVAEDVSLSPQVTTRVQEFTAGGEFVLELGQEVNKTTKGNLCTRLESEKGAVCGAPTPTPEGSNEHGAFNFGRLGIKGNALTAGGASDLLYVGGEHRVQEFDAAGEWKGEIPLAGSVGAIAVDDTSGEIALVEDEESKEGNVVRDLDASGGSLGEFEVSPREARNQTYIHGLAFDAEGRLAVTIRENVPSAGSLLFGGLYEASSGHQISAFTLPPGIRFTAGIGFNGKDELYLAADDHEILAYESVSIAELVTSPAVCAASAEHETDATFDCTLSGTVNPFGVAETEVWFRWGPSCTALDAETAKQSVASVNALVPVSAAIEGVKPNAALCYGLAGYDQHVKAPESLSSGESTPFTTPPALARIVGAPSVAFVRPTAAVMVGELNPENANTRYSFQYGTCGALEGCATAAQTPAEESAAYGTVGGTLEASGLQPATTYRYRLLAVNGAGQAVGPEGQFTTAPAPSVSAQTGPASAIGTTGAVVTGSVNPDGEAAAYTFELGVYAGAATQYGTVLSSPLPASATPQEESLQLTGLQPGTTYAYRIRVTSPGYGEASGAPLTFTTAGLPVALEAPTSLPLLAVPGIAFPAAAKTATPAAKCKAGQTRGKHGRCVKAKRRAKAPAKRRKAAGGRGAHGKGARG